MQRELNSRWIIHLAVGACAALAFSGAAHATTFSFIFDDNGLRDSGGFSPGPPVAPYSGSGTFSTTASLGDGEYTLADLGPFSAVFDVDSAYYVTSDIQTPLTEILLEVSGAAGSESLNFSDSDPSGFGTGPEQGSLDLINQAGDYLSFAPPAVGPLSFYQSGTGGPAAYPDVIGRYAATQAISAAPEPSAWALLLLGIGALGVALRTRQARRDDKIGSHATT